MTAAPDIAVLDACVLFRGRLTDLLLHLAEAGLFEPAWSAEIHAEWMHSLHRRRGIPWERCLLRQALLQRAFPAASCVPDPACLAAIQALCRTERQRRDAHVIAAAVAAEARWIVTANIADFPRPVLARHGLQALRPDAFCAWLATTHPAGMAAGLRAHRAGLGQVAEDSDAYLALLAGRKMSLPGMSRLLAAQRTRP
nr:PIN domain-containing protein [Roseicella aerolata]